MRRFLIVAVVLILLVAVAGSITANIVQYNMQQQKQQEAQGLLDARATRIGGLETELGTAQTELRQATRVVGTLEAQIADPPQPTPTPATLPTVTILSPEPGEQFPVDQPVTIQWQATNMDRVNQVTLQVDGVVIDEMDAGGEAFVEGEFVWTPAEIGLHDLRISATNALDLPGEPAVLQIEVAPAEESSEPEPEALPSEVVETMNVIEGQVAVLRGLEPMETVTRTLFTQDELRQFLIEELDEELGPDEAQRSTLEMAAFDLVPIDLDMRELIENLYTEQIAGFYDPETRSFTVIDEDKEMSSSEKVTYAHEFVHALQDQYYGLEALDPEENSDDASLAVTSLIEGDATYIMQLYMLSFLTSDELYEALAESMAVDTTVLDSAPAVIQDQMMFPYDQGFVFVDALYQQGGYAAIDDAFADPPVSTEQILHPERYLAGETPQIVTLPPLTDTLGSGWEWVDENVLGEYTLQLYLEEEIAAQNAAIAADGWGGDRYAVYYRPDSEDLVMVMQINWDSRAEADEFSNYYQSYAKARFDGAAPVEEATCWSDQDTLCLFQTAADTLIIRAPDLDLAQRIRAEFPDF